MKNLSKYYFLTSLLFIMIGCGDIREDLVVTDQTFGYVSEGMMNTAGIMIAPSVREIAWNVGFENATGDEVPVSAVWQFRDGGAFHEFLRTERTVKEGDDHIIFPLTSSKDLFLGEYMIELYADEILLGAQRFYVTSGEKSKRDDLTIFELSKCSTLNKQTLCESNEMCEVVKFETDEEKDPWVCEPR